MRIHLTKSDVMWSYIASVTSLLGSIITLFMVLFFLDDEFTSIWYIFSSIGAMTVLFDFGFSVTFARNVTYCWSGAKELLPERVSTVQDGYAPNFSLMKRVLSTCKLVYLIIAGVVLIGCATVGTLYIGWVSRGVDGSIQFVAWAIYSLAIFLNLYYGYYSSFLRGVGAVDLANRNTAIAKATQIALMLLLLELGFGLIGACVAYLSYGFVFRMLCKRDFYTYRNIGEQLSNVKEAASRSEKIELLGIVWHNSWREGIISLSSYLCSQASTLVTSAFMTLAETGVYSLCLQIANMVATIAGTLYVATEPSLQEAEMTRDKDRTLRLMGTIVSATLLSAIVLTIGVLLVAPPFVAWIKPTYELSILLLAELCCYQSILKIRDCYATYFSCSNRIPYVLSYCLSSVVGLLLSALVLGPLGGTVYLFVFAQMVAQLAWNAWIWSVRAHREMGVTGMELLRIGVTELARRISALKRR